MTLITFCQRNGDTPSKTYKIGMVSTGKYVVCQTVVCSTGTKIKEGSEKITDRKKWEEKRSRVNICGFNGKIS